MKGNLPENSGEISTRVECFLVPHSRKGEGLKKSHTYNQELFMYPLCFINRAKITLEPGARMAVFVLIIPGRK